ncbi:MAG: hypothetical protein ACKPJD_29850 [Planctomycetaceae bacterium]
MIGSADVRYFGRAGGFSWSVKWLASGSEPWWRDLREFRVLGEFAVRQGFALAVGCGFIRMLAVVSK